MSNRKMNNIKLWIFAILHLAAMGVLRAETSQCVNFTVPKCNCMQDFDKESDTTEIDVLCDGIDSEESLQEIVHNYGPLRVLALNDLKLPQFPGGLFRGARIWSLSITNTLVSLGESAFDGLGDELAALHLVNVTKTNLDHLKVLKGVRMLELGGMDMSTGLSGIKHLPLFLINIVGTPTSPSIESKAFSILTDLSIVQIVRNPKLTTISRDLLPQPAEELAVLNLADNAISSLPNDMFDGMPFLQKLILRNNQIKQFSQSLYQPVFNRVYIEITGNLLHCDKNILWMVLLAKAAEEEGRWNPYFGIVCYSPEKLKDRKVETLQEFELLTQKYYVTNTV